MKNQNEPRGENAQEKGRMSSVGSRDLFGWTKITDRLPKEGDVIACCAEHRAGGPMFWAGHVVETRQGFAVMETRGVPPQRFILTYDTLWLRLPPLPNNRDVPTRDERAANPSQ